MIEGEKSAEEAATSLQEQVVQYARSEGFTVTE